MPIFEHVCKEGHVTEEYVKSASDVKERRRCDAVLDDGSVCKRMAERMLSRCGVIFQPYAFSDTCFASYSDRERYVNDSSTTDMGNAHKDSMQKLPPNRQFTRFKGTKVKSA